MASCRTGRLPLVNDPIFTSNTMHHIHAVHREKAVMLSVLATVIWYRFQVPHRIQTYKGPENPHMRIRHRRFPSGGLFWGWGANGLNRDCNLWEMECWAGYTGKEYAY